MTDAEKIAALRAAVAALMEGSKYGPSALNPKGAWGSIRMPSDQAMNMGRDALAATEA